MGVDGSTCCNGSCGSCGGGCCTGSCGTCCGSCGNGSCGTCGASGTSDTCDRACCKGSTGCCCNGSCAGSCCCCCGGTCKILREKCVVHRMERTVLLLRKVDSSYYRCPFGTGHIASGIFRVQIWRQNSRLRWRRDLGISQCHSGSLCHRCQNCHRNKKYVWKVRPTWHDFDALESKNIRI